LEELADATNLAGARASHVLPGDLGDRGSASRIAEQAVERLGGVDILINNAGGGTGGLQWIVGDHDKARQALEINYWSPLALIHELVPGMRERRKGAVVNVTSVAQVMPLWFMGHYSSSKAAFAKATESLRLELQGSGVHVLEVIPGPVDTAVQGETRTIPGAEAMLSNAPLGQPGTLARLIVRALKRERKRVIYPRVLGAVYAVPGIYRVFSSIQRRRLARQIDTDDKRVVLTGSFGDPEAQEARTSWERDRGR
jgi:short-subunit dehydrogenase